MTPLAQIRALLAEQRSTMETLLDMNERAVVDRVQRIILDGLDAEARKFLRIIAKAEKSIAGGFVRGSLIIFNLHGGAPAVASLVRQSERHRCCAKLDQARLSQVEGIAA